MTELSKWIEWSNSVLAVQMPMQLWLPRQGLRLMDLPEESCRMPQLAAETEEIFYETGLTLLRIRRLLRRVRTRPLLGIR